MEYFPSITWSTYSILVAVEATRVKSSIGVANSYGMSRAHRTRCKLIAEVDIIRTEIRAAEGRILRYWISSRTGSRERCVISWTDSQDARVEVIRVAALVVGGIEQHLDVILGILVVGDVCVELAFPRLVGLTEESHGPGASDIELLGVDTRADQDHVGGGVVGEGADGSLDGREVGGGIILADVQGAIGTAIQWHAGLSLAVLECSRWNSLGGQRMLCQQQEARQGLAECDHDCVQLQYLFPG